MRTPLIKFLLVIAISALFLAGCLPGKTPNKDTESTSTVGGVVKEFDTIAQPTPQNEKPTMELQATQATITTNVGSFTIELYSTDAPNTVGNFIKLANEGFYNGTKFHRIIKDFMIQGGDPNSKDQPKSTWGTGGPGYRFNDEFNSHKLVRGSLAMANSGPNTNGSQFFIVTIDETPWLDGKHTNFGKVIEGMGIIDTIESTQTDSSDRPLEDIIIEKIELK